MGQVFYRKYRSRSLSEIVGQEHITDTLAKALASGRIAHAYLLTGPRGTGKTSVARILAHEINQLEYSDEPHLDIIEIDAASNNSVDDVRDLRDKVMLAPTSAKFKIYIIDEVHMLSKQAFNALLKTLEEPPSHVIFILATTEVHKLPATIMSRVQRHAFRPVNLDKVIGHLKSISQKEKFEISDDALHLIAEHGEGSFRDSISLLDQVSSLGKTVDKALVEQVLGRAPSQTIQELLEASLNAQHSDVISNLKELYDQGYESAMIASQLSHEIRSRIVDGHHQTQLHTLLLLLKNLLDIPQSHSPRLLLEATLFAVNLATPETVAQPTEATATAPISPAEVAKPEPPAQQPAETPDDAAATDTSPNTSEVDVAPQANISDNPITSQDAATTATPEPIKEPSTEPVAQAQAAQTSTEDNPEIDEIWQQSLQNIKLKYNTLYGIARMAKASLDNDTLTLAAKFAFHQKRLNEPKNKSLIAKTVSEIRGTPTSVVCTVLESNTGSDPTRKADISAISNIFGGAELI